ncbi:MAG: hypothetical protein ABSG46_00005, partial [Candidatus Binataceae bacterium]
NDLAGSFNGVINVMAPFAAVAGSPASTLALGATGDGYHDDTPALQNAVLAACGMTSLASAPMYVHNGHPRIVLPYTGPTGCYRITQPVRLYCGTVDFGSDPGANVWGGHAKICPNFAGDSLIAAAPGANNITYAAALVGSGNSMTSSGGAPNIVLSDWLNSSAVNFNSNTQIGFDITVNLSALGSSGELWKWATAYPGLYNIANNGLIAKMTVNSSGQTSCSIWTTTSGVVSGTSTDTGFTLNATHAMSFDWDGSNLRCFRDGVLVVGPLAATGSLYTSVASGNGLFSVSEEPEQDISWWPDTNPSNSSSVSGEIDAINISKVALHTAAYTPSTTKPTVNSNTQLLINFEGLCTSVDQAGCSPDGTQLGHTGLYNDGSGQMNVYLPLRGGNGGSEVPSIHVHDLELCSAAAGGKPDGLFAIWAQQSEFDHLSCANTNHTAFNFYNNDWEAWTHDDQASGNGHPLGFELGTQYNECDDMNLFDSGGQVMSVSEGGGATDDERFKHAELGYSVYDWIYNGTSPNHLADFMFEAGNYGETIIDGQINTRNGAPYIDVFGGNPPTVIGDQFDTFGQSTYAAEVFNHVDANSNTHLPNGPDVLINTLVPKNGATPIPLSNPANNVIDLGDQNGPGLLLAGAGFVPPASTFANLGAPANGTEYYCTDCVIASTCAGSGTGAIAKRLNGAWVCN